MSALPIVIAVLVAWTVIATTLALTQGRALRRERQDHAEAQETLVRYRSALAQLKERAEEAEIQVDLLQRAYAGLKRSLEDAEQAAEGSPQPALPSPEVMVDGLDVSSEIGTLFEHVGRVARAIRNYSAYSRGHQAPESSKARYDLHWLSDCLHSFDHIGRALARGDLEALNSACTELLSMYEAYPKDGSGYDSRDTFKRLAADVPLADVTKAVRAIGLKATSARHGALAVETDPLV